MGWSIETLRPKLDLIFNRLNIQYDVYHVTDVYPRVSITYEGDLPPVVIDHIVKLFPDNVYVDIKKSAFPVEKQEVG